MSAEYLSTLERIHAAARDEFLEKGFQEASLRNIVKTAGVTTGAFYGYYGSKAELFRALVGEVYDTILATYQAALDAFASLPLEQQPEQMGKISRQCMKDMLQYMFAHRDASPLKPADDAVRLDSTGRYIEDVIDEIVEREVDSTHKYYQTLAQLGQPVPPIDPWLEHILVTAMMKGYFEIVLHDMPPAAAQRYLEELNDFFTAGWARIMGQA